jgi:hypothetical protein
MPRLRRDNKECKRIIMRELNRFYVRSWRQICKAVERAGVTRDCVGYAMWNLDKDGLMTQVAPGTRCGFYRTTAPWRGQ